MIRDTTAHRIAAEWHGGQTSALYALSSSGAILGNDTIEEYWNPVQREVIDQCMPGANAKERKRLTELLHYISRNGPRPAVPGWYENVIRKDYK